MLDVAVWIWNGATDFQTPLDPIAQTNIRRMALRGCLPVGSYGRIEPGPFIPNRGISGCKARGRGPSMLNVGVGSSSVVRAGH